MNISTFGNKKREYPYEKKTVLGYVVVRRPTQKCGNEHSQKFIRELGKILCARSETLILFKLILAKRE